jgi:hypothetical protein
VCGSTPERKVHAQKPFDEGGQGRPEAARGVALTPRSSGPVHPGRGAPSLRELASGVDALYLPGRGVIRPAVIDALEAIRAVAVQVNPPLPTVIGGLTLTVAPHSWGEIPLLLRSPRRPDRDHDQPAPADRAPPAPHRIPPRGRSGAGCRRAWRGHRPPRRRHRPIRQQDRPLRRLAVSGTHGRRPGALGRPADMSRTYVQGRHLSGFDFGTRASPSMVARICDKTMTCVAPAPSGGMTCGATGTSLVFPCTASSSSSPGPPCAGSDWPRRPRSSPPVPIFGPTPRNNGSPTRDLASSPPDRLGRMVTLEVHNTEQRLCPGPANRTTVNVALGKG